ncbi:MAG: hypothetical protein IPK55_10695 [Streptococcus sp.]|nr:hypothetical protein [Streptococcus sp.]
MKSEKLCQLFMKKVTFVAYQIIQSLNDSADDYMQPHHTFRTQDQTDLMTVIQYDPWNLLKSCFKQFFKFTVLELNGQLITMLTSKDGNEDTFDFTYVNFEFETRRSDIQIQKMRESIEKDHRKAVAKFGFFHLPRRSS